MSVNAYINSILATGLTTSDGSPARGMLLTTVVDIIRNLVLYGFSCYRILALPGGAGREMPVVQVPSGKEMPVRFSPKLLRWVPDHKSRRRGTAIELFDTGGNSDDSDSDDEDDPFRWQTIVWMPPTESRCTSFAAQAYHDSVRIEELYKVCGWGQTPICPVVSPSIFLVI